MCTALQQQIEGHGSSSRLGKSENFTEDTVGMREKKPACEEHHPANTARDTHDFVFCAIPVCYKSLFMMVLCRWLGSQKTKWYFGAPNVFSHLSIQHHACQIAPRKSKCIQSTASHILM